MAALARRHLLPPLASPDFVGAGGTTKLLKRCVALGSSEDDADRMLVPLSVARPPPSLKEAHRLCVPASRRVCLYRGTGAPALVTIVLTRRLPAYMPEGHFSRLEQARSYAWGVVFLAPKFLERRHDEVQGAMQMCIAPTPQRPGDAKHGGAEQHYPEYAHPKKRGSRIGKPVLVPCRASSCSTP